MILIVEDSPQMATNLEIALTTMNGADVRVAESGEAALRFLNEPHDATRPPVAAVVTDLEMPRMSGYELIAMLRSDPRYSRVPIIVSSGSIDPEAPRRAMVAGADAYFAKPYSPGELRQKLETLLKERGHV